MAETFRGLTPEEIKAYLRKSRSDDALLTVEEVLAKHESILDEWAENNVGGKVPEENKYREVVSGETIDDRPEMLQLLKDIESPLVKAILVVEVQRLSRGDLMDAGRLIRTLRYTNTLVITVEFGRERVYDLRDEEDRDRFERELKKGNENLEYFKKIQKRGRELSVQQGNFIGSIAPYGYKKIWVTEGKKKCPTLEIKEDEANVVRMIFDWYVNENVGRTTIANRLDEMGIKPPKGKHWSPHSLQPILTNVHYLGKVKWNFRKTVTTVEDGELKHSRPRLSIGEYLVYEGKHPAIIEEEIFNASVEKHGNNPRNRKNNGLRNPLAGLVVCKCGRAMSLRFYKRKDGTERNAPRLLCDGQTKCNTGSCLYSEMIDKVKEILLECIADFEIRINGDNKNARQLHNNLIKDLENKLAALDKNEISLWDKYAKEGMPQHIFETLKNNLITEREEIKSALCKAKESMPEPVEYEERLRRFRDALDALNDETKPAELQNKLLKACIERIEYHRDRPQRLKKEEGEKKGERFKTSGGHWYSPPMELDVKLKA